MGVIALVNNERRARAGRFEHARVERAWRITSDVTVSALLTTPVLERVLPGRLGCYVLPSDAVFERLDVSNTALHHLNATLEAERVPAHSPVRTRRVHMSVATHIDAPPQPEHECIDEAEGLEDEGADDDCDSDDGEDRPPEPEPDDNMPEDDEDNGEDEDYLLSSTDGPQNDVCPGTTTGVCVVGPSGTGVAR